MDFFGVLGGSVQDRLFVDRIDNDHGFWGDPGEGLDECRGRKAFQRQESQFLRRSFVEIGDRLPERIQHIDRTVRDEGVPGVIDA